MMPPTSSSIHRVCKRAFQTRTLLVWFRALVSACREMPVLAASLMIATILSPLMNSSFSCKFTFFALASESPLFSTRKTDRVHGADVGDAISIGDDDANDADADADADDEDDEDDNDDDDDERDDADNTAMGVGRVRSCTWLDFKSLLSTGE